MGSTQSNLDLWVNNVSTKGLPGLRSTINAISEITENEDLPVARLASFIQQDPGLTAHILRHTQGAYRIPLKGKHNTVNRAIVMLGFSEIKSLCMSLSLVEDLMRGNPRPEFMSELGISFHAAIQARSLAFENGERNCEEIFTAALLSRIGNLAFWSLGGEQANILSDALKSADETASTAKIERNCLGFSLEELTRQLNRAWNLDSYVYGTNAVCTDYIKLGFEIAESSIYGWDSNEFIKTLNKTTDYLKLSKVKVLNTLRDNSEVAIRYAIGFGIPGISATLYKMSDEAQEEINIKADEEEKKKAEQSKEILFECPSDAFQLITLKSLGTLIEAGTNINELVTTALEGMHRGLAIDRAIFCLLTPNRKALLPKTCVNSYSRAILQLFSLELETLPLFNACIINDQPIWSPEGLNENVKDEKHSSLVTELREVEFIIAPISVKHRPIGLFYADRGVRKAPFSQVEYESLKHLVFQVKMGLEQIHHTN